MRLQLVALRKEKGLKQREVAAALDISRSHYTKIEAGIRDPNLALAKRIADFLGGNVDALFFSPTGDVAPHAMANA